jgi:hypothetical protein
MRALIKKMASFQNLTSEEPESAKILPSCASQSEERTGTFLDYWKKKQAMQ